MNSSRYQVLYQIVRDVLAIHVSIVASESAFSTPGGGHVLDSSRSSLSPNTVKALIYMQNWLKDAKKKRPIKFREYMNNVEDIDGFKIDTSKNICVPFVCCMY